MFSLLTSTTAKTRVSILNNLPDNENLKLHCQSGDDDLGVNNVHLNALASAKYDIYVAKRDDNFRCPTYCSWEARADGVYGYTEHEHVNDLHFPWHRPQISHVHK
ncbi:Self-incompatibility protein [Parasponia andersonii]|uniref:Self-incompatibility protein n=1 Tax=Parasponia andersonii TaxID=3476 RepID=A0A2P5DNV8_PARAD|nr:Self-incompatibility protein [Parasponia andersonii]